MLHRTKHWIAVVGSPRRGENTERLVDVIAEALAENSIVVKKFYLDQGQMSPCTNCEYCMQTGNCLIDDEITEILQAIKTADGIILASPSYNYNVTAQMKVLLDRSFVLNDYTDSLWRSRVPAGKKAILAGVCKGKTEESMGYTLEAMRKSIDELGIEVVDSIAYYDTKNSPVGSDTVRIEAIKARVKILSLD